MVYAAHSKYFANYMITSAKEGHSS